MVVRELPWAGTSCTRSRGRRVGFSNEQNFAIIPASTMNLRSRLMPLPAFPAYSQVRLYVSSLRKLGQSARTPGVVSQGVTSTLWLSSERTTRPGTLKSRFWGLGLRCARTLFCPRLPFCRSRFQRAPSGRPCRRRTILHPCTRNARNVGITCSIVLSLGVGCLFLVQHVVPYNGELTSIGCNPGL